MLGSSLKAGSTIESCIEFPEFPAGRETAMLSRRSRGNPPLAGCFVAAGEKRKAAARTARGSVAVDGTLE
jgi:hypothetical protein